jgi:hypothetical protein
MISCVVDSARDAPIPRRNTNRDEIDCNDVVRVQDHDVSNMMTTDRGSWPRSNVSMIRMRPPQHGQGGGATILETT